ncbi:hypothetical protein AABC73_06540 [Pseudomonas sp. G.S.17]|uniref:hypothetical protein n=1 Tax=Pseudomonas sp. G.S.17 TaxID=3137451 RepID=UPI00311C9665
MDNSTTSIRRSTGELDPTFADNGIFTFTEAIYGFLLVGIGKTVTAQDGKILVPAAKKAELPILESYLLAQLNADGTPDRSFGTNGSVSGHFVEGKASYGASTAITREGKIILSGCFLPEVATPPQPALAQFLDTGELDKSFGENGIVRFDALLPPPVTDNGNDPEPEPEPPKGGPPDTAAHENSFSITPLPDGKLVFSGRVNGRNTFMSFLGRLNPDGSLDHSFASKGYVVIVGNPNTVDSHVLQPDGKILISGQIEKEAHTTIYVRRYLEDGTLDPTFTFSEQPLKPGILEGGHIMAIALHADGRIILGANKRYYSGTPWNGVLMCLTSSGAWDSGFNGGQPLEMALGTTGFRCVLKDILVDGDGVILLGEMGDIAVARYFLDGTPDAGFGDRQGWWEYPGIESYYLVRQDDGKILATSMFSDFQKTVARFLGEYT